MQTIRQETQRRYFEQLLSDQAYSSAWRYCCLLAPCRQDAEDLLQDSLVHALQRLDHLRDEASFRGWLLSIVRSRFLNSRRRLVSDRQREEELVWVVSTAGTDPRSLDLAAALKALPRQQRLEITLFYLEGLSLRECAQALGLSQAALQARLHRGRAALRQLLDQATRADSDPAQATEECHV